MKTLSLALMGDSSNQLLLFDGLPDVRQPAQKIVSAESNIKPARKAKKTREVSIIRAETDAVVLEPV